MEFFNEKNGEVIEGRGFIVECGETLLEGEGGLVKIPWDYKVPGHTHRFFAVNFVKCKNTFFSENLRTTASTRESLRKIMNNCDC